MPIYPQSVCFLFLFLGARSGEKAMPSSLLSEPTLQSPPASAEPDWAPPGSRGTPWRGGRRAEPQRPRMLLPHRVCWGRGESSGFVQIVVSSVAELHRGHISFLSLPRMVPIPSVSMGLGAREEDPGLGLMGQDPELMGSGLGEKEVPPGPVLGQP